MKLEKFSLWLVLILLAGLFLISGCGLARSGADFLIITATPNPVVGVLDEDTAATSWSWTVTFTNRGILDVLISSATQTVTTAQGTASEEIYVGPILVKASGTATQAFQLQSSSFTAAEVVFSFHGIYVGGPSFSTDLGLTLN